MTNMTNGYAGMRGIVLITTILVPTAVVRASEASPSEGHVSPLCRSFLALGLGLGQIEGANDSGAGTLQFGQNLGACLHLIEELDVIWPTPRNDNVTVNEESDVLAVGVRWALIDSGPSWQQASWIPYRYFDYTAIYAKAVIGVVVRERMSYSSSGYTQDATLAPMVGAALGWLPFQSRDYALGVEGRYQVARFNEGVQGGFAAVLMVQLTK